LQPQSKKTNDLAVACSDQIITNFTIDYKKTKVGEINNVSNYSMCNNDAFLPHPKHPFDHFLVEANIKI
jgi:hypothetical protein